MLKKKIIFNPNVQLVFVKKIYNLLLLMGGEAELIMQLVYDAWCPSHRLDLVKKMWFPAATISMLSMVIHYNEKQDHIRLLSEFRDSVTPIYLLY